MAEVIWLGDEDPQAQVIEQFGHRFVKGEPVKVDDKSPSLAKFKDNPAFSFKKVKPVESKEPEPVNPAEGTELDAVRKELDQRGITYTETATVESLRGKLAAEEAKQK